MYNNVYVRVLTNEGDIGHVVLLVVRRAASLLRPRDCAARLQLHHVAVTLVEGHAHVAALAGMVTSFFVDLSFCWV